MAEQVIPLPASQADVLSKAAAAAQTAQQTLHAMLALAIAGQVPPDARFRLVRVDTDALVVDVEGPAHGA